MTLDSPPGTPGEWHVDARGGEARATVARPTLDKAWRDGDHTRRLPKRLALQVASTAWLGPYRVLEPLGQGGMGVVYRARHSVTERAVAIKTVRVPASRWIESLRREIEALTQIRHPGIVRIVDHGVHHGRPWYAMDLLEGESLREFGARIWSPFRTASAPPGPLRALTATDQLSDDDAVEAEASRPTPVSSSRNLGEVPIAAGVLHQVLGLMRRLCATLAFLHGEGFVSCDMKPENVLVVGANPVLIDFGLSRRFPAATGREAIDAQRVVAGTVPYMSPEQLRGELVDARSDLYSVGCILYELLTGSPPFVGTPFSIRTQHLTSAPTQLSRVVREVPEALGTLVMRLLAKDPLERVAFADEVAGVLGEIAGDTQRLHDFPPPRPYLYRPRFVGRTDALARLSKLRDSALSGHGALALIGGESGAGKTRLALELTRVPLGFGCCVIASESVALAPEQPGIAASAPLHAVRPLLRAIADRCQEGGADATNRLLGPRRSVLAAYEPLLLDVPASEPLEPMVPLEPEASRLRVLRYVAQSLTVLAQEQPVLWILDDIAWADELSLAFLQSLTEENLADTPAFLVATYRTEDASDSVRALAEQSHVVSLVLPPLQVEDVSAMIADMLAAPVRHSAFAAYVADAADGNPFFVTEHIRTAVTERLFYRDQEHAWQLQAAESADVAYERLPLPGSLRELIEHRLNALSPAAREAARVAAVLGRESEAELLTEIVDLPAAVAASAIDELIRRSVLEQPSAERIRFVHDKLREVAYATPLETLQQIHLRAATALERKWSERADRAEIWATLAHHFSEAGRAPAAVEYLTLAARHAKANYANADAISHYGRALALLETHSAPVPETGHQIPESRSALHEALGDVLALVGQGDAARAAYEQAALHSSSSDPVAKARLGRKTGNTWEGTGDHEQALRFYMEARETLPPGFSAAVPGVRDEWISARFDELRVNYWLARGGAVERLIAELGPIVAGHADPRQLAGFYQSQIFHRFVRDRYLVSEATLELSETIVDVCGVEGAPDRAWAYFQHGFTVLLSRGPLEAEEPLTRGLELAERAGDVVNQARAGLYLAVAARMRGDVVDAADRSVRAARLASQAGMRQYTAAVKAIQGWLRMREGDHCRALELTGEALLDWARYGGVFPFHWLALVPRLEAQLAQKNTEDAIVSCKALLARDQRKLPPLIESHLSGAIGSWELGQCEASSEHLREAMRAFAAHHLT